MKAPVVLFSADILQIVKFIFLLVSVIYLVKLFSTSEMRPNYTV
jgi:hypothetical protein